MKCSECKSQLYPKSIDIVGMEQFDVQGYLCLGDCSLNGLPVLIELKSSEYAPLDQDNRVLELSETLQEPDYIKYINGHVLPPIQGE